MAAQNDGVQECANLVKAMLEEAGLRAVVMPTEDPRFPVVYAEDEGRSSKQLLFYNHYDVQPARAAGAMGLTAVPAHGARRTHLRPRRYPTTKDTWRRASPPSRR